MKLIPNGLPITGTYTVLPQRVYAGGLRTQDAVEVAFRVRPEMGGSIITAPKATAKPIPACFR